MLFTGEVYARIGAIYIGNVSLKMWRYFGNFGAREAIEVVSLSGVQVCGLLNTLRSSANI